MKRLSFKVRGTLVALLVLIMFALHNSFWLWKFDGRLPLLFGFMPFSFSFHVAYALLATAVMALVVNLAWPDPPAEAIVPADEKEWTGQ